MVNLEKSNGRLTSLLGIVPKERLQPLYERHGVEPSQGPKALADEIRLDGSNTIASLFRGIEGVAYLEVARDVADKMDVEWKENQKEEAIEQAILGKLISEFLEHATQEEREQVNQILEEVGEKYNNLSKDLLLAGLSAGSLALLIKQVGRKVVANVIERIVAWIAARQVAKEGAKRIAQIAGLAIPLLNAAMIAWTVIDIAGPAFRKTVPTVIEIALLRLEFGQNGRD